MIGLKAFPLILLASFCQAKPGEVFISYWPVGSTEPTQLTQPFSFGSAKFPIAGAPAIISMAIELKNMRTKTKANCRWGSGAWTDGADVNKGQPVAKTYAAESNFKVDFVDCVGPILD